MSPGETTPDAVGAVAAPAVPPSAAGLGAPLAVPPLAPTLSAPSVAAAAQSAQLWANAMRQRKQPCTMAPWDENIHAFDPVVTVITMPVGQNIQIAAPNPQRIGLIIASNANGGTNAYAQPVNPIDPGNLSGIIVGPPLPPLYVTQKEWLSLPSVVWYGCTPSGGVIFTVIELILKDWPRGG